MKKLLPNFRITFLIVGFTFILLPLGLFTKGLMHSMAEFKVPEPILNSSHYFDAILWVYVHMVVIGLLILTIGYSVNDINKQKWIATLLFLVTVFYTYLDFRSADWIFGNALYKGKSSIGPAIISLLVNLLFFQLVIRLFTNNKLTKMKNIDNKLSSR
jgi:hypothetical protein